MRERPAVVDSPLGPREPDRTGAVVGVVRLSPDRSYRGWNELLQKFINGSDEGAWQAIKAKIDYTYENLDPALCPLEAAVELTSELAARLNRGQKLLFKPNLVFASVIDPQTHGPDRGSTTCTEWMFLAALMRWFHDKLGVRYGQMAVGEAATMIPALAAHYSLQHPDAGRITPEAVIEGRSGDFYGGWGFYFARKYLAECPRQDPADDPMAGYSESVSGSYVPPGRARDKLMVYDLNRIFDDTSKGRRVPVPGGVNFQSITLHKVIVGGEPGDAADREAYPGCVLVNVPKLKVHNITLFTNVIKNLGIGLYPMQSSDGRAPKWDYSLPYAHPPGMKGGIPHEPWVPELDHATGLPKRHDGAYVVEKTGGIDATMIDIVKAVQEQGTFMVHVVDGIETINIDHTGQVPGTREPEGLVFAGQDPVATDLLCARYLFGNVPYREAIRSGMEDGNGGYFPQRVPIPALDSGSIVTKTGYDCPLIRDKCLRKAEERGLGKRAYHVVGWDALAGAPLVSVDGHLGVVRGGKFEDRITDRLYFDGLQMPWDLQRTVFQYMEAVDQLSGSSLKRQFLQVFDEDGDGVVKYEDVGTEGILGSVLHLAGSALTATAKERFGFLSAPFRSATTLLRSTDPSWNRGGHKLFREYYVGRACFAAYRMSLMDSESPDPFAPGLVWGRGRWPSFQLAWHAFVGFALYGPRFPTGVEFPSLYGMAFRYADFTQNEGRYTGNIRSQPRPGSVGEYMAAVHAGAEKPMDFVVRVPAGYENVGSGRVPNVEVTADRERIWTAEFAGGQEVWALPV